MLGDSGLCWLRDLGVGVTMGLMIETPHSLHTHTRSSLYIYNAIQHLLQGFCIIRMMQHHIITALWDLRVNAVGIGGGFLLVLMIETPHTLHTYIRSSLYIYNAIQHLLQGFCRGSKCKTKCKTKNITLRSLRA